jgi:hypothetical protein
LELTEWEKDSIPVDGRRDQSFSSDGGMDKSIDMQSAAAALVSVGKDWEAVRRAVEAAEVDILTRLYEEGKLTRRRVGRRSGGGAAAATAATDADVASTERHHKSDDLSSRGGAKSNIRGPTDKDRSSSSASPLLCSEQLAPPPSRMITDAPLSFSIRDSHSIDFDERTILLAQETALLNEMARIVRRRAIEMAQRRIVVHSEQQPHHNHHQRQGPSRPEEDA